MIHRIVVVFAFIAVLISVAQVTPVAQAQQNRPVFSATTNLLTLDVTVLDRDGKPVPGLQPEDFEIKVNGTVRPVQTLAFVDVSRVDATTALTPSGVDTGASLRRIVVNSAPTEHGRVFVIVVDDLSFEPGDGKALFVSAESFVSGLPPSDLVGFAMTSGSRTISPTLDRGAVLDALKHAAGSFNNPADFSNPPIVSIGEALQIEENGSTNTIREIMLRECISRGQISNLDAVSTENLQRLNACTENVSIRATRIVQQVRANRQQQLRSLEAIVTSMRHTPGIKHVVFLSGGVPVTRDMGDLAAVARAMAVAGVQVSTMVQEGDIDLSDAGSSVEVDGEAGPVNPGRAKSRREDDRMLLGGAQTLTDMSGGLFYRVIGQPQRFFDRVTTSAAAVYRLGVALPADITPGEDLRIATKVTRSGLSALASHYAEAPEPDVPVAPEQRVVDAVVRGETDYGIPVTLGASVRRGAAGDQIEVGVAVSIPGGTPGPLTTVFGLLDSTGALKRSTGNLPATTGDAPYNLTIPIQVPPGRYQIRFAAADAAGNVGAVSLPFSASLHALERMDASDLLTWIRGDDGQMRPQILDELPPDVPSVTTMVELYPTSTLTSVPVVRFVLFDAAGKPLTGKDGNLTQGGGVVRADAEFDTGTLPTGLYTLRAEVEMDGRPVGTVSTSFRRQRD